MNRRKFLQKSSLAGAGFWLAPQFVPNRAWPGNPTVSVGVIGLDTSHSIAFTKILNSAETETSFRVTHAYPHGSLDIESSVSRIPGNIEAIKALGVSVVDSLDALLEAVDVVLLETNDGRRHLEQAELVLKAGKRVFIDKPLAGSLKDAEKIFDLSEKYGVPTFSASALRFSPSTVAVRKGSIGQVLGADTYSPAPIEPTHPDLFWYGIHGVESLFTVMGTGCKSVQRFYREGVDVVVGEWEDGRIGTFRGLRSGKTNYGGTAFGTEGIATVGLYEGYEPLVDAIIHFFETGIPPVKTKETLEIFAFMQAAEESKRKGGKKARM